MTPCRIEVANKRPYLEKIDYLWYNIKRVTVTKRNGEYDGEVIETMEDLFLLALFEIYTNCVL